MKYLMKVMCEWILIILALVCLVVFGLYSSDWMAGEPQNPSFDYNMLQRRG